jgi:hypothetical protein
MIKRLPVLVAAFLLGVCYIFNQYLVELRCVLRGLLLVPSFVLKGTPKLEMLFTERAVRISHEAYKRVKLK